METVLILAPPPSLLLSSVKRLNVSESDAAGAAEAAAAAFETVIPARKNNPIDDQDRQTINAIAGAVALQIDS